MAMTVKSDDYNKLLKEFPIPAYGFFDISGVDELRDKRKGFVLLQYLRKGQTNAIGKIDVGIVCVCNSRADALRNRQGKNLHGQEDRTIPNTYWLPFETKRMLLDFTWNLPLNDLKSQYEHTVAEEFASEESKKRGKHRVETALKILKDHGGIGRDKVDSEDRLFKIASYGKVDIDEPQTIRSLLEAGNIMVGHFRVSRNYFYLKPGEIYMYDKTRPYIHAKSNLPVSHAVMVIGDGRKPMAPAANGTSQPLYNEHVMIQNSEGKRFGIDGLRLDQQSC
ncbi:hypothetical protein E2562_028092 [Oryza meyeriana var. granulata]|uniref:Uncharacterized protein n=1 Tax=Oryza meyeriana var. granulata TaxID=110450 RepID=A0A6G1CAG6_9ORYZ|nr:hypothetical protein E2562_028092 [Oryza meyeriana var. granulata]